MRGVQATSWVNSAEEDEKGLEALTADGSRSIANSGELKVVGG